MPLDALLRFPTEADSDAADEPAGLFRLSPASEAFQDKVSAALNGKPPADLMTFLATTRGFGSGGVDDELDDWGEAVLVEIFDYGNGDRAMLAATPEGTHVWWLGHDPWFFVYHGSLAQWLERINGEAALTVDSVFGAKFGGPVDPTAPAAFAGSDAADFVASLPPDSRLHDLRARLAIEVEEPFATDELVPYYHPLCLALVPVEPPSAAELVDLHTVLASLDLPQHHRLGLAALPTGTLMVRTENQDRRIPQGPPGFERQRSYGLIVFVPPTDEGDGEPLPDRPWWKFWG